MKGIATVKLPAGWEQLKIQIWYTWHVNLWEPGLPLAGAVTLPRRFPMLKSNAADVVTAFENAVPWNYHGVGLFLNEPTHKERTDMTPEEGLELFEYICAARGGMSWVVANDRGRELLDNGGKWTFDFLNLVRQNKLERRVHGVGFHWYRPEQDVTWAIQAMKQVVKAAGFPGVPLWLTEFGSKDLDVAAGWMGQAKGGGVRNYFWYSEGDMALIDEAGALTPLGQLYKEL